MSRLLLAQKPRHFATQLMRAVEPVGKGQVVFSGRKSASQSALLSDFCRAERKHCILVHVIPSPKATPGLFLQAR